MAVITPQVRVIAKNVKVGYCRCGWSGNLSLVEIDGKRELLCKTCTNQRLGQPLDQPVPRGIRDKCR